MPSPTTVLTIITRAMIHIGALASTEAPNAAEAQDGLAAFNDVLETWSLQGLAVYSSNPETFNTVGGQASYTIGPGGNWNTVRPVSQINGGYTRVNGVDFPFEVWTEAEYAEVGLKTIQQPFPERLLYINSFPLGTVTLWPVPVGVVPVTIYDNSVLTNATAIDQILALPPGYARALAYAVAVELASQYGAAIDVSPQAKATMAHIKRANRRPRIARFDPTLAGSVGGTGTWVGG